MGVADSCPRRGSAASATLSRMDDGLDSQLEGGTERSLRTLGVSEWEAGSQTGNPATQVGLCRAGYSGLLEVLGWMYKISSLGGQSCNSCHRMDGCWGRKQYAAGMIMK